MLNSVFSPIQNLFAQLLQPRRNNNSTAQYGQVLSEAGQFNGFKLLNGDPNPGQVTLTDLKDYKLFLQLQDVFASFAQLSGGGSSISLQSSNDTQAKLGIVGRMIQNFSALSGGGQGITIGSLFRAAGRDGNYGDVSATDLQGGGASGQSGAFRSLSGLPAQTRQSYENRLTALAQQHTAKLKNLAPESPAAIAEQAQYAKERTQVQSEYWGAKVDYMIPGQDAASVQMKGLVKQLSNVEPESPAALAIQARVGALAQQVFPPGERDRDVKQIFNESEKDALRNVTDALKAISANLDPGSPAAKAIAARMKAIDAHSKILDLKVVDGEDRLPPALLQNFDQLNSIEPESPTAIALQARIASQIGGLNSADRAVAQQKLANQPKIQVYNTIGSLQTLLANLEPESAQAKSLQDRLSKLYDQVK